MNELINEIRTLRQALKSIGSLVNTSVAKFKAVDTDAPTFYRYIRPVDILTGEIDSQSGVTLKIVLDYQHRRLNFQYSICNHNCGEPSFSKKIGKQLAEERPVYAIPLWDEPGPLLNDDLTSFIVNAINNRKVKVPYGERKHIVDQFNRSPSNFFLSTAR